MCGEICKQIVPRDVVISGAANRQENKRTDAGPVRSRRAMEVDGILVRLGNQPENRSVFVGKFLKPPFFGARRIVDISKYQRG